MRRSFRYSLLALPLLAAFAPVAARAQLAVATAAAEQPASAPAPATRELVVVLHGMGRTSYSMRPVEMALKEAGYDVLNIGYSSYCCAIADLGAAVRRELDAKRRPEHSTVHFVGHSLGGILARWVAAQDDRPEGIGRIVMLTPPNQGSKMADRFTPLVGWLLEPIDELRTDSTATVRKIPPPQGIAVGVVAARGDDTVDLSETHIFGEADHVVVDGNHTFVMRRAEVHRLMLGFLRDGRFPLDTSPVR
jgi:pimeloyl-ACP methyl ester carboxylesterase